MPDELDIVSFQSNMRQFLEDEDKARLRSLIQCGGGGFQASQMDPDWIRRCEELGLVFRLHEGGKWVWSTKLAEAVV